MATETRTTAPKPTYVVKQVEQVVKGTDVMVRLFTLSADDVIPWHSHSESTDHYFVLAGTLRITTRDSEADHVLVGGEHGKSHQAISILFETADRRIVAFCSFRG